MPYYTFHDKNQSRPEIVGNWLAQLVSFVRNKGSKATKTDTPGMALQSMAGRFMASGRMSNVFQSSVIAAIKKYFRIEEHISDPTKPMVSPRKPTGQAYFTFESCIKGILKG